MSPLPRRATKPVQARIDLMQEEDLATRAGLIRLRNGLAQS